MKLVICVPYFVRIHVSFHWFVADISMWCIIPTSNLPSTDKAGSAAVFSSFLLRAKSDIKISRFCFYLGFCLLPVTTSNFLKLLLKRSLPRLPKRLHNSKEELAQLYLDKVCFYCDRFKECHLKHSFGITLPSLIILGGKHGLLWRKKVKPMTEEFSKTLRRNRKDKQLGLFTAPVSHFHVSYMWGVLIL